MSGRCAVPISVGSFVHYSKGALDSPDWILPSQQSLDARFLAFRAWGHLGLRLLDAPEIILNSRLHVLPSGLDLDMS